MTRHLEQLMQADLDRIRELEREVETWKAAYRKAIRRDDVIIRRLMERHYEHG